MSNSDPGSKRRPTVVIVGAGITGIALAKACKDEGLQFTVYEKSFDLGGTWRDNVYPGIGVDSPAGSYNLPFAPKFDWSRRFAPGAEILSYLRRSAKRAGILSSIRFNVEVLKCTWQSGEWQIRLSGNEETTADVLILATGFIRVPIVPTIEGEGRFEGPSFHSSKWDTSLDPRHKRIGIIGTGSSGIQITTALATMECDVTQFIRSPQWINTIPNTKNGWLTRIAFRAFPNYGKRVTMRRLMHLRQQDPKLGTMDWRLNPGVAREAATAAFWAELERIKDPELRQKMTPTDIPGCRRVPMSEGYYDAIQRPNVRIVRENIAGIEKDGVVLEDGSLCPLDVLIYATGFETHAYFKPMEVFGVGPEGLGDMWKSGPFSYRTMMVPGFPNLFVMHGPYAPVNNISTPISIDHQTGFVMRALDFIESHGAISPTKEATERHLSWVRGALNDTTYTAGCNSWFTAADGYQLLWPFGQEQHTGMFAVIEPNDYEVTWSPIGP